MERECGGITSDVVIVGNDVYDYVEDRVACVAINKYVCVQLGKSGGWGCDDTTAKVRVLKEATVLDN